MSSAMRAIAAISCVLLMTLVVLAQRVAPPPPPPPKPAESGPSLEVTMKFIQEKVSDQGKINYAAYVHDSANNSDWSNQFSYELSKVSADAASCRIDYHELAVQNGNVTSDKDCWVILKSVEEVVVMSREEELRRLDSNAGHPTWSARLSTPVWIVITRRPKGVSNYFYFHDESMANRVAKALNHAVELCGGGKKDEPF